MCSIDKQATSAAPRCHPPPLHLSYTHVPSPFLPPQVPLMLSSHETALLSVPLHVVFPSSSVYYTRHVVSCCPVCYPLIMQFVSFHFFHFSLLLLSVTAVIEWPFDMEDCNSRVKLSMSTRNPFYSPKPPFSFIYSHVCCLFSFFHDNFQSLISFHFGKV